MAHKAFLVAIIVSAALVSGGAKAQVAPNPEPIHENGAYIVVEINFDVNYPEQLDALIARTIEVLERRLAPANVAMTRIEDSQIIMRSSDSTFATAARLAVSTRGLLAFHLVREVSPEDAAFGIVPPGTMLAPPHPSSEAYAEVVERRPRLTSEQLRSASSEISEFTGESLLVFRFNKEGAQQFCAITRNYISQRFAVLIDNQVVTAPRINEPICGGEGQISGNFTPQAVNDLAAMLNAGSLPAPLVIVAEGVGHYTP